MEIDIFDHTDKLTPAFHTMIGDLLTFSADYLNLSPDCEISVTIVDNDEIQQINKEYRNKDYPTDVISFAMNDVVEDDPILEMDAGVEFPFSNLLGDLFVSIDKVKEQAKEYGHSEKRELAFLVVHGFLHLNGYDHHTQASEQEMFQLQEAILTDFGVER